MRVHGGARTGSYRLERSAAGAPRLAEAYRYGKTGSRLVSSPATSAPASCTGPCQAAPSFLEHDYSAGLPAGFAEYYAARRDRTIAALRAGLQQLQSEPQLADHVVNVVARLYSKFDEQLGVRGWAGEVLAAYAIEHEPNPHTGKVVVSTAAWFTDPYRIQKGVDMVGVDLDTGTFCLIEVKSSGAKAATSRQSMLGGLKADLHMSRALDRWLSPHRDGRDDLLAELISRKRKGQPLPGGHAIPDMQKGHFHRIGVMACTDIAAWRSILDACPHDDGAPGWLHLKLVSVADMAKFIETAVEMEEAIRLGVTGGA